jgi:hypothetical protein
MTAELPAGHCAVRRALDRPAASTLPGRSALALSGWLVAERRRLARRPRTRAGRVLRVWRAARRARWHARRLLGREVAGVTWQGDLDGTATATVDGLWLWWARGELFVLVACPHGGEPHMARVPSLAALGELVAAAMLDPPPPPWTCTALCARPLAVDGSAGKVMFVGGWQATTADYMLTTTIVAAQFASARHALAAAISQQMTQAFVDDQAALARRAAATLDLLPAEPSSGAWEARVGHRRYWLHRRHSLAHDAHQHGPPAARESRLARG